MRKFLASLRKLRKGALPFILGALVIILPVFYLLLAQPQKVKAAWYDTGWLYRTRLSFTNSGSPDSNKKVRFIVNTASLYAAGKIKADCSDSRFTDINGKLLQYYLDSAGGACNTASTSYYVLISSIISGDNVVYHYYGNPTATSGSVASQFSQATFTPGSSSSAAEEKSPGPALYYKFDEGGGVTAHDSTAQRRDATISSALWLQEVCVSGKCLQFNGLSSTVTAPSQLRYVQTVGFWVRPTSASASILDFDGGTHYIGLTGGNVIAGGFISPVIYVNGKVSSAVTLGGWNFVEVTTTTPFDATSLVIGRVGGVFFNGFIDEFRLYQYPRSAAEVKADFAARGSITGVNLVTIYQPYGVVNLNTTTGAVTGQALFVGLDTYLDFTNYGSNVTVNTTTGIFSGYAFSTDLGWVAFGTTDNPSGPVRLNFTTGKLSGKAVVLNTGAYLDFTGYNSMVSVSLATGAFYGYAFSEDLGWVNFGIADNPPAGAVKMSTSSGSVSGKAYGLNTAAYLDFTDYGSNVSFNTSTGVFSGYAFSEDLGWVAFGTTDNPSGPVRVNKSTGAVTGKAYVINTGAYLDFTNYGGNVLVNLKTGYFSGYVFSEDAGWFSFGVVGAADTAFTGHLIGHWLFDEGYGVTANNSGVGTGLNGIISGATWSNSGKYGKALSFDGTSSVVTVTNNSFIELNQGLSGGFTFSSWFYANSDGENHVGQIFSKGSNTYLRVSGQSGSNLNIDASVDLTTSDASLSLTQPITTGTWNYVSLEYNASTSKITLYVNGRNMGSSTNGAGALAVETNNLLIGGTTSANFNGLIDEVKLYNYPLSDGEIKVDYNRGASLLLGSTGTSPSGIADNSKARAYCPPGNIEGDCSNGQNPVPVAEYNLDEKTGQYANDISGNNNTGTLGATNAVNTDDPTWTQGKFGAALKFDGVNDYVSVATTVAGVKTIGFWVKPTTTTTSLLDLNGTDYITAAGTIAVNHIASPSVYVNGIMSSTLTPNIWQYVTVTTGTGVSASAITLGKANGVFYNGVMDQVRLYNYVRSQAQIAWDYNRGAPTAWYKFDECAGTTAHSSNDSYITSLNATIYPQSNGYTSVGSCNSGSSTEMWGVGTNGKINSSLGFDGNDDYVATGNIALNASNGQTYTTASWGVWVYPTVSISSKTLIHKDNEFRLTTDVNGKPQCAIYSGGWQTAVVSSKVLPLAAWSHVVCTYDGVNINVYVNGSSTASQAQTLGVTSSSSTAISLGRDSAGSGYFSGKLDDVRIFNYGLSKIQVGLFYNNGAIQFSGN